MAKIRNIGLTASLLMMLLVSVLAVPAIAAEQAPVITVGGDPASTVRSVTTSWKTYLSPGDYDVKIIVTKKGSTTPLKTVNASVSVPKTPVLKTIKVSPSYVELFQGQQQKFVAQGYNQYGGLYSTTFTWTAPYPGVITIYGTFASKTVGLTNVTAKSGTVAGTAKVLIKSGSLPPTPSVPFPQ